MFPVTGEEAAVGALLSLSHPDPPLCINADPGVELSDVGAGLYEAASSAYSHQRLMGHLKTMIMMEVQPGPNPKPKSTLSLSLNLVTRLCEIIACFNKQGYTEISLRKHLVLTLCVFASHLGEGSGSFGLLLRASTTSLTFFLSALRQSPRSFPPDM